VQLSEEIQPARPINLGPGHPPPEIFGPILRQAQGVVVVQC